MNKHTIIVIVASIVIAGTIGYSVLNIFVLDQIKLSVSNQEKFRYYELINRENISICNPSSFYTSFNDFKINLLYEGRNIGTVSFSGVVLEPNSNKKIEGKFTTNSLEEIQYLSMHFDAMFDNTIPIRINPENLMVVTEIQTNLVGLIPYTVTNQYTSQDFWNIMNISRENFC